jgi:hypothetical protein
MDLRARRREGTACGTRRASSIRMPNAALVEPSLSTYVLRDHGIAIHLHCATVARSGELAQPLRRHAAREENLLYQWADAGLDRNHVAAVQREMASRP